MTRVITDPNSKVLLNAVTANTVSDALEVPYSEGATFYTTAAGVSTGATRVIEAQDPADDSWHVIDSMVSTDADFENPVVWLGRAKAYRATISSYTDGTYTVTCTSHV